MSLNDVGRHGHVAVRIRTDPLEVAHREATRRKALLPEDRSRLVDILFETLHDPAIVEVEAAWELEIERRLAQYDRGGVINRCAVQPKPWFERTHSGSRKTQRRFGAEYFEQHIQTGWTQVRCYALRNRY